ncbi:MAG: acylphosphatase, partial [Thermoplasmata archaeon]
MKSVPAVTRRILRIRGTVQGVGFRPFVFREATELGLRGRVWNDSDGVVIEAEGPPADLDTLALRLASAPPPRALVERIEVVEEPPSGLGPFSIVESDALPPASARVSPDLATCPACLGEMEEPGDRRRRYAFINCTDCGPRYSIVRDVPYD